MAGESESPAGRSSAGDGAEESRSSAGAGLRLVQVGLSLVLLALLAWVVDVRAALASLSKAHPAWLFAALCAVVADRLLMAFKWIPLLEAQTRSIPRFAAVRAYFASGFAAVFLPPSVGADVLRSVALGRGRALVAEVAASVAVDRVLGLLACGLMSALALALALRAAAPLGALLPVVLASTVISLAVALLPLSRHFQAIGGSLAGGRFGDRLTRFLGRFAVGYGRYRNHLPTLVGVGALSLLEQCLPVASVWLVARALHVPVGIEALLIVIPPLAFFSRLPISVAGLGVVEGGLVYLLRPFGVAPEEALAIALASRVLDILSFAPGAFAWRDLAGTAPTPGAVAPVKPPHPARRPAGREPEA